MKKIMFNDKYGLTTAVLEGRKTMTRRVITIPEKWHGIEVYGFCHVKGHAALELTDGDDFCIEDPRTGQCAQILPTYRIDEEVALAQPYKNIIATITPTYGSPHAYDHLRSEAGWNNKMFVRADLMPHRIRITGIKVERLQDISDSDILREGITTITEGKREVGNAYGWDTKIDALKRDSFFTPRAAFASLIDKVSGRGTWDSNPWVFAYEFELVK